MAIDLEFAGIDQIDSQVASRQDRFRAWKQTIENISVLQIGICPLSIIEISLESQEAKRPAVVCRPDSIFIRPTKNSSGEISCLYSGLEFLRRHGGNVDQSFREGVKYQELRGILKVLSESGKSIVGHNVILDLLYLIHIVTGKVPENWDQAKQQVRKYFPSVFDTKLIYETSCQIRKVLPVEKGASQLYRALENIRKAQIGQNVVSILPSGFENFHSRKDYHSAGFDAFQTSILFAELFIAIPVLAGKKESFNQTGLDSAPKRFLENNILAFENLVHSQSSFFPVLDLSDEEIEAQLVPNNILFLSNFEKEITLDELHAHITTLIEKELQILGRPLVYEIFHIYPCKQKHFTMQSCFVEALEPLTAMKLAEILLTNSNELFEVKGLQEYYLRSNESH